MFCLFQPQLDLPFDASADEQMSAENVNNEIKEIVNDGEGMSDVNDDEKEIDEFEV